MANLVTLATEYPEVEPKTPGSPTPGIAALVIATTSRGQTERFLSKQICENIGDVSIISHCLHQLAEANIKNAVVVVGQNAEAIKASVHLDEEHSEFQVTFVELGERFRGTYTDSVLAARQMFEGSENFLLLTADTIFDAGLITELSNRKSALTGGDMCRLVVETDLGGMVGLTNNFLYTGTRPMESEDRIAQCSSSLVSYSGIGCGMYRCAGDIFQDLEQINARMPDKDNFEFILQSYACTGKLLMLNTNGRTWFAVETPLARDYVEGSLTKVGNTTVSDAGVSIRLTGQPTKKQRAPSSGGDWAEFDVGKWRNAVFKAKSFHATLYDDTTKFVRECAVDLGGAGRCTVIEVGCGTGEAIFPLQKSFKYAIGVDFNQLFIDFCNSRKEGSNTQFVTGDATNLGNLMQEHCAEWTDRPKVVMCVGNTIGIMPDEIKESVYMEMARVAGPDGVAVIVYWNGNKFGDAVQHFYHANPQLCGPFKGEHVDLDTCTLRCPSGYTTHWTKPEEAREIIESYGLEVVSISESSDKVGVLSAFRLKSE